MNAYIRQIKFCCLINFKNSTVKFKLDKKTGYPHGTNNELDYNNFKIAFES